MFASNRFSGLLIMLIAMGGITCLPADFKEICKNGCSVPAGVPYQGPPVTNKTPRAKSIPGSAVMNGMNVYKAVTAVMNGMNEGKAVTAEEIPSLAKVLESPNLSTLASLLEKTGLLAKLDSPPYTVFAPTNEAFEKVDANTLAALLEDNEALSNVLLRHVVQGKIQSKDISVGLTKVSTLGGEEIEVIKAGQCVSVKSEAGSGDVIMPDVMFTEGIGHVINMVI